MGTDQKKRFKRVNVEISNVCNLQCSFCPPVERQKQEMDVALFRKVICEIAPLTEEVALHLMGEPLLHGNFPELVGICGEASLPVNVTTNGMLLQGVRRDALLSPIVRQVNFSVHSFSANFPQQSPDVYLERIFAFAREAETCRPDLYINFRLWDLTGVAGAAPENDRVRTLIEQEYGIRFCELRIDPRRQRGFRLRGRIYANFDSRFTWPKVAGETRQLQGTCHALSNHFGIHADGRVVPCCLDKEADLQLGDIKKTALEDILTSERARNLREGFDRFELREKLCQKCGFIERFARKKARRRPVPHQDQPAKV